MDECEPLFPGFATDDEYLWRVTNPPTWFLSSIVFHYALMPAIDHLLAACSWAGHVMVVVGAAAWSVVPFEVCSRFQPDWLPFNVLNYNPILFLPTTVAAMATGRMFVGFQAALTAETGGGGGGGGSGVAARVSAVMARTPVATVVMVGAFAGIVLDSGVSEDYFESKFYWVSRHGRNVPVVLVLIWALAAENRVDPITWLLRRPAFVYLGGLGLNTYLLHYPMKDAIQDWTYPWAYPDGDGEMGHKWLTLSKHGDEWCKTPGKNTERGVETPFEAGAYTRPLSSSTSAVSDTHKTPYTPSTPPNTPLTRATQSLRAPPMPYKALKLS